MGRPRAGGEAMLGVSRRRAESIVVHDASQICEALHIAVQEHALIEQALADVLALRSVGGEALANRLKQLQAVGAESAAGRRGVCLNGPTCWNAFAGCLPACVHCIPWKALASC